MAFNVDQKNGIESGKAGPFLREKKSTFSRIMKLKRRISNSFGRMSISREDIISDADRRNENVDVTMVIGNRYSEEFLDTFSNIQPQPEPNGNFLETDVSSMDQPAVRSHGHGWLMNRPRNAKKKSELVKRAWSVTQGAIAEGIFEEEKSSDVQRRQKKPPPRPKSECLLQSQSQKQSATTNSLYRLSTFRGTSPFGRSDAYIKLEQLGEGSYATVYKGVSNLNNKLVALKEIRLLQEEGTPFTAIREASLLRDLKHSNVVTLHDIVHTKETLTFVFEFVHTDLSQYLERHGGGLNPKNVKLFLFQLLRGLAYIHSKRVLHRDLKPQNLLISEIGELKLADFGLARAKSVPSHTYSHEVVTLWYRPPDVLLGSTDYSTSLDIWGVGCIFIEMITGFASFPGVKDAADQLDKIWRVFGTPTEDTWEGVGRYPNYKFEKYGNYTMRSLSESFSKLHGITYAESIASEFLQMNPMYRIPAEAAMRHCYFEDLPPQIYEIPDQLPIFTVSACKLAPEINNRPVSVMRAAAKLREKM